VNGSTQILAVHPDGRTWDWISTGWPIRLVRPTGSGYVAASLYDGVVLQPN
jgi:hypothetical protein